ncbi:MAG: hypothetical protein HYR60_23175 [Acidobacteria bacterium]|nr:hypothetical protein [Acidobacteriota bacterium]
MRGFLLQLLCAAVLPAQTAVSLEGSFVLPLEDPSIQYETAVLSDPASLLQRRIDKGQARLEYRDKHGYLISLLRQLHVPVSSQVLVFSKTSFQLNRISPQAPRALYFSDDVYVGWVQDGDVMEVSSVDPHQGAIFYTVDQRNSARTEFKRREECLQCHASPKTLGVPGHLVRSVYAGPDGFPFFQAGSFNTDHRSPFKERWGGWYVTGLHGPQRHMGNIVATDRDHPDRLDLNAGANLTSLKGKVDTEPYLSPHSDIVALMVLEHQTRMHNLMTRVSYETRLALSQQEAMNRALGRPLEEWSDSTRRRVYGSAEVLLKYLLFTDEAPLEAPVKGVSAFQAEFAQRGPSDRSGRSLRQFDLKTRLFRYPCSFLIYSAAFDALPGTVKDYLYRRLWEILSGKDQTAAYATLSRGDREAVLAVLLETKQGLPAYWKP